MTKFVGFIRNTESKAGVSKKGKPWTVYNAEIHSVSGEVHKLSFGFDQPDVKAGDYVSLEAFERNGFTEVDKSTVTRLDPPAEAVKEVEKAAAVVPERNYVDRQDSIIMQHSQEMAILFLDVLMKHDALPHSKAANKGGEAKRFEELLASVDKLTVKFYEDVRTLRVPSVVADMGVISTAPSSELPTNEKTEASALDD